MRNPFKFGKEAYVSAYLLNRTQLEIKILLNEIREYHLMAIDIHMR